MFIFQFVMIIKPLCFPKAHYNIVSFFFLFLKVDIFFYSCNRTPLLPWTFFKFSKSTFSNTLLNISSYVSLLLILKIQVHLSK